MNLRTVDIFMVNESKLNCEDPFSFYSNIFYKILRLDRDENNGGGILVFYKKELEVSEIKNIDSKIESIYFQLKIDNQTFNFISAYKSPSVNNIEFLEKLENLIFNIDSNEHLFIIGDLNMDLHSSKGNDLKEFLLNNDYKNFVNDVTRIGRREKDDKVSKTLIDVVIHNSNMISSTKAIGCPFSDHHFVLTTLKTKSAKLTKNNENVGRSLSEKNLLVIADNIGKISLNDLDFNHDVDIIWNNLKNKITIVIDEFAPKKNFKLKDKNNFPWYDKELREAKDIRDYFYYLSYDSKLDKDLLEYRKYRAEFQSLNRNKMKEYFNSK